ncbi:hypothetical protein [Kaarinaea lacus]
MRTFQYASAMVSKTMGTLSMVFITMLVLFLLTACSTGGDSGSPPASGNPGDTIGSGSDGSGGTSNSPGTDTGSGSSGGSTDGGTNTGGSSGDSGGGSSGGTTPGTFGTLASLYTAQNERLNVNNCNMLANGSVNFPQAVFRLIGQAGNDINAVITLTPDSQFLNQFNQVVITLQGAFTAQDTIEGSYSALSTLNGDLIDRTQGTFDITVILGTTLSINFVEDSDAQACHISGGMYLEETTDPGAGSGTGGGSSGGTGGDTGGGTGGSSGGDSGGGTGGSGDVVTAGFVSSTGQFGSLQMQSQEFPEDSGTFEMTTVQFVNIPGNEMFAWTNDQQTTVNIYFGLDNSNTTLDSTNSRDYLCDCFPTVDLINNQVFFNNVVLMKTSSPTGSITLNGTLTFPQAN